MVKSLRNKHKLYKKYFSNPTPFYLKQFKQYRNKLNHIIRRAKKHYFSTELSKCKNNMRTLSSIINHILNKRKKHKSLPNEFKVDGSLIKDPATIAYNFNRFFTHIGPTLASKIPVVNESPLQYITSPPTGGFHLSPVTVSELGKILGSLKNSAPGYDNVDAELLKVVSNAVARPLTHIFN